MTVLMAPSPGLTFPAPMPETPTLCTFEGVFAGSGVTGQWTYRTKLDGTFSVTLSDATAQLQGILGPRLGGRAFELTSMNWEGFERTARPRLTGHETISLIGSVAGAAQPSTITVTVKREQVCMGMPRTVKVGETWTCQETVRDTWSTEGGPLGEDSGTARHERTLTWTYLKDEPSHRPDGTQVLAAVLELRSDMGDHERYIIDPATPWCPLQVDRLKLDEHIVGSDKLVALETSAAALKKLPPADNPRGNVKIGAWALWTVLAAFGVIAGGFGVGFLAGRRAGR